MPDTPDKRLEWAMEAAKQLMDDEGDGVDAGVVNRALANMAAIIAAHAPAPDGALGDADRINGKLLRQIEALEYEGAMAKGMAARKNFADLCRLSEYVHGSGDETSTVDAAIARIEKAEQQRDGLLAACEIADTRALHATGCAARGHRRGSCDCWKADFYAANTKAKPDTPSDEVQR